MGQIEHSPLDSLRCGRMPPERSRVSPFPAESDSRLIGASYTTNEHGPVGSLEEAAILRGVEPRAIIKTIVIRRAEDDYVFVLVPGDRVIDWTKLRDLLGVRRLSMPDADEAFGVTGYVRGTITPFGASCDLPVVADVHLSGMTVSIGGGDHGKSLTIDGDELVAVLDATIADVTKEK